MIFAAALHESLQDRSIRAPAEFASGVALETVLDRYLRTVESMADTVLLTSILLLDREGKHLRHVAAPSLPSSYCEALDGTEIGPTVGSCGTAAFLGRAIYVTDIATDPLWADYRHLALPHGLRACWSTPIRNADDAVIGTFAIYHLTARSPIREEVDAIGMISGHVARAIEWARRIAEPANPGEQDNSPETAFGTDDLLHSIEADFESIASIMHQAIEGHTGGSRAEYLKRLHRVKRVAEQGAKTLRGRKGNLRQD